MRAVHERVREEQEVDHAVYNFRQTSDYEKFQKPEEREIKLKVHFIDDAGVHCTTRVFLSKVLVNKNSRLNKSRKLRKLKKSIELENL